MESNENAMPAEAGRIEAPVAPALNQPIGGEEDEGINISDFFSLCMRCWRWFVLTVILCGAIGLLYVMSAPFQYTRTAQVMVEDDTKGSQSFVSALSEMGFTQTSPGVANELLAFESPALVGDVVKRLDLRENYIYHRFLRPVTLYGDSLILKVEFPDVTSLQGVSMKLKLDPKGTVDVSDFKFGGGEHKIASSVTLCDTVMTPAGRMIINPGRAYKSSFDETIEFTLLPMPIAISQYKAELSIELANEKASVIDFSIKDTNIQRGDDFLNTLIDIYNEKWVEMKSKMAIANSEFINERLNVIEKELGNVDSDIASYKGEHLMPDVQAASEMYMSNANENIKKQLEVQTQIDITRFLIEYIQNPNNKGKLLPGNLGIDNQGISDQIDEYNSQQLKRDQLLGSTGENSPLVKDIDTSLASLRQALNTSLVNQKKILNTQLNALVKSDRATNAKIASTPSQAKYLLSVERQQKVKEQLYLFLLQKREENELSLAFTPCNTRVITPPTGSMLPTSPATRNVLLISIVIGILIPAVVLFMIETLNSRVRNRSDLDGIKAPFIGEIPEERTGMNRYNRIRRRWREAMGKESRIENAPILVVKPHSNNVLNEAFRMVRSNIEFMTNNGKNKVAMVTSFNPGSGKSFISINLGAAMAIKRKDSKVLLIDLDLRRASLSKVVGNHRPGITDYLSEAVDDISSIVKSTDREGLFVIPVGTIPPNPSELLYSPRLQSLVDKMREQFDFILLDCPPTDIVADATIITPLADLTIFVVRAGLLDRRLLPEVNRFYDAHRFNNLMVLLNGTSSMTAPYRRYAYHNYYNREAK